MKDKKGFKQLLAWQKAYELALDVFKATGKFSKAQLYTLIPQTQRAAISVSANIAEGYERGYRKEYIQFLKIAKGSLGELETYLLLSNDLGFLKVEEFQILEQKREETGRLLKGLIDSLS